MDLPDCPPGAEGYQDSVTEVPKKPDVNESNCTKAEKEFQEHLNSLKIKTDDGDYRCMVERRGRDISGKWIYLCFPCAAVCSGESVLQTHISGKKHKTKLSSKNTWSLQIFEEHPYVLNEKGIQNPKTAASEEVLQKMAQEVGLHNGERSELEAKYGKYRNVRCHIQDELDKVKAPLLGVEYLIEHPPDMPHYEPSYICTLCYKQGHPRTIINHLTCSAHRVHYLSHHYSKAWRLLAPYRGQARYREGVATILNRLAQRIEDKYGRLRPVNFDKDDYEKDKERINKWIYKGPHFSETADCTLEEVVDIDLINSLDIPEGTDPRERFNRDPSPPIVSAPMKPRKNDPGMRRGAHVGRGGRGARAGAGGRRASAGSLSDVSDEPDVRGPHRPAYRPDRRNRYEPYEDRRRETPSSRTSSLRVSPEKDKASIMKRQYKLTLAENSRKTVEESSQKALAYHEKNPEKHPLYPEEWKKFWNRRYKEIQAEGKDPSKHDFKPEWISFWMTRMKELHEQELRVNVTEIYRKLCLTPPHERAASPEPARERPPPPRDARPPPARDARAPPGNRERSPRRFGRRPSPPRRSPGRRASPARRSPDRRYSPPSRRTPPRRRSPPRPSRSSVDRKMRRSVERRSPRRRSPRRSRSRPHRSRSRSPVRTVSPLSKRALPRNRSPILEPNTVLISDDDLKPDDGLSPWNSDDSLGSLPDARSPLAGRSRADSVTSRASRHTERARERDRERERHERHDSDVSNADNVVATLRLLVALEDYLGSLGPKVVDLLAEAIKMEKDKANSSEELLERDTAVVLIETAKEKLKGAAQAGLVTGSAAHAVRTAVVRAAATLHEADRRTAQRKRLEKTTPAKAPPVPIAGVGEVNREQIAQQMAAALIAQGKTDVSSEELAQLVDAVVGMAEAKRREAEKPEVSQLPKPSKLAAPPARAASGPATALQLLQTAYDDKKGDKDSDAPDAMDGLSDSDLETLLKNFNELSAEEQHSLIAYLKKLEARAPERVERLRQYVSAAPSAAPPVEDKPKEDDLKPVTIESDDDDYTVEDVFKSATQKVKEDQIRQEMEIVKKSLEETKPVPSEEPKKMENFETVQNMTSATDLFALVQASLKSASAPTSTSHTPQAEVVSSNSQPRSFGDLPDNHYSNSPKPLLQTQHQMPLNQSSPQGLLRTPHVPPSSDSNWNNRNESPNPPTWGAKQVPENRNPVNTQGYEDTYNDGAGGLDNYNQAPRGQSNFNQGPRGGPDDYNQMSRGNHYHDSQNPQDNYQGMRNNHNNYQNQAPRGNFAGNRMHDGYDNYSRDTNQKQFNDQPQYGNMEQFSNLRQINTQQSYGNPQNTQQPYGNPQNTQQPYGNPQNTQQSYGNPQNNQQPYGNPQNNQYFGNQQKFGNTQFNKFGNDSFRGQRGGRGHFRGRGRGYY